MKQFKVSKVVIQLITGTFIATLPKPAESVDAGDGKQTIIIEKQTVRVPINGFQFPARINEEVVCLYECYGEFTLKDEDHRFGHGRDTINFVSIEENENDDDVTIKRKKYYADGIALIKESSQYKRGLIGSYFYICHDPRLEVQADDDPDRCKIPFDINTVQRL